MFFIPAYPCTADGSLQNSQCKQSESDIWHSTRTRSVHDNDLATPQTLPIRVNRLRTAEHVQGTTYDIPIAVSACLIDT